MGLKKSKIFGFSVELRIRRFKKEVSIRLLSLQGILITLLIAGVRYVLHLLKGGAF